MTWGRSEGRFSGAAAVVLVLSVLVLSGLAVLGPPAASGAAGARGVASPGAHAVPTFAPGAPATGVRLAPRAAGSGPSSGRGVFFDSSNLTIPSYANSSCWTPITGIGILNCENTTFDPSINITPSGTIGVAVTTFTNLSACGNVSGVASTMFVNVAFQSSTNGGTTWSPLQVLGNENCSAALPLEDAWQPTLTSLANGTFVLAYIEFNVSGCSASSFFCQTPTPPAAFPYDVPNSALVVQESYNGGTSWTSPAVVNATYNATAEAATCGLATGSPLYRPWITSNGTAVYLAYENISDANDCSPTTPYSASVHLTVSANGGVSWGAPVTFPTQGDGGVPVQGVSTNFSVNPSVLAAPNGQVYVAYATGLEGPTSFCQGTHCATSPPMTQDLVVANATGGTGPWTVHTAATDEPFNATGDAPFSRATPFDGLRPQLAYDGATHALALLTNSQLIGTFCHVAPAGPAACTAGAAVDDVVVLNSTNGGQNWSTPEVVGNVLDPDNGSANAEELPALTVDPNGTLAVDLSLFNDSACPTPPTGVCGAWQQVVVNSTDGGATWGPANAISPYTWSPPTSAYLGEYDTATVAPSGAPYFAWTNAQCAVAVAPCSFTSLGGSPPLTGVVVSTPFDGVGVTLTLSEAGLAAGLRWSADVAGNPRSGPSGTNLVVSGVPTTQSVGWTVPWVNATVGVAWQPTAVITNPSSPATFASNTTLGFTFAPLVQLTIDLNPALPAVDLTPGYDSATYSMSPLPGVSWVPAGSTVTLAVAPQTPPCASFCSYENLTWTSWTGLGNGSTSSTALSVNVTPTNAPVTETANFIDLGPCTGSGGPVTCTGPYGYPLSFVETGLPNGTPWSATIEANSTANGTFVATSTGSWLNVSIGQYATPYTLWTVPDGTTGLAWVPTASPDSPVQEPRQRLVNVTYTLEAPANATFLANLSATGLPNDTAWSAELGGTSYAVTAGSLALPIPGGRAWTVNGSVVDTEDGVAYSVQGVSVRSEVMGATWQNTTDLATAFWLNGSAQIVLNYTPSYWLTVTATTGGTAGPASEWVAPGTNVSLTATSEPHFEFVDWTGTGPGASTLVQDHSASITITPNGTVDELATFRPVASPVFNVTVTAVGLPAGTNLSFSLGNRSVSVGAAQAVVEVAPGSYPFVPTTAYAAGQNDTRWAPTSWNASFGPGTGPLVVAGNGSVTVNFTTEYVLDVVSGGGGSVTPSDLVGATWQASGTMLSLTAVPNARYAFVGWNASGSGVPSSTSASTDVTVRGPTSETASFALAPLRPPATYTLNVTETGLPNGTAWFVAASPGIASASGTGKSLLLTGLNGSYTLTVPTVYLGAGTRYVANATTPPREVGSDQATGVAFSAEYAVSIVAGPGGTVGDSGTTWVDAGSSVSLTATAASGEEFLTWQGTGGSGASPYSGSDASATVRVTGPTNETAEFGVLATSHTSGSPTADEPQAIGILVVLLVVGLVVGLLIGRRRRETTSPGRVGAEGESERRPDGPPEAGGGSEPPSS